MSDHPLDQLNRFIIVGGALVVVFVALLIALLVGAVLVLPSLAWLYLLSQRVGRATTTERYSTSQAGASRTDTRHP